MTHAAARIEAEALDWVIRARDPAFDGWEAFEAWLAADPRHPHAYHAAAIADEDIGALFDRPVQPPRAMPQADTPVAGRWRRRSWLGGALAASLAAVIGWSTLIPHREPYVVETPAGMRRTIALEDGSRIDLNGGTRMTLDRADPRYAVLEHGEAAFIVHHDESRPFLVEVGDAALMDAGTMFNVVREGGVTQVGVREGAVVYNPDDEAVRLDPGMTLRAADGDTQLVLAHADTGGIAAWREGQLVYDGAPLAQVAQDLSRNLGVPISADPAVATRSFRGVITIGRDREALLQRLGPLLDVRMRRVQQGWVLTADSP